MATESPAWLDATFVQKILQNAEKDKSIMVSGTNVKPATAKGDNYSSDMYRIAVELSRVQDGHEIHEERSLIVKIAPEGDARGEMIESVGVFETEFSMMSVTLPRMNEILEKLGSSSLSARCFYIQHEKPIHIVLDDLATKGFRMADRHAGLDLDYSLLALQNLGRFHAASIALREKDSEALTIYKKWMLHKDQPSMVHTIFNSSAKTFADETAKWHEVSPRIKEKLYKLSEVMFEKGCEAALYREDDFNVLNHGDFWVNNMLFRYDEQRKPIDHIFVDFQTPYYGSPAVDLHYFFGTSPSDDVRLHHRELLLREYHASLTSTVAKLECETKVPSFDRLQEALNERAFCGLVASITVLPFVVLEKGEEVDINKFMSADEECIINPGYRAKTYRKIMTRLLPLYDAMGLLDV